MAKLPEEAEWLLSNNFRSTPPFAVLTVNFHSMTGSIKAWKTVEQLSNVHLLADEEGFWSAYSIGGNRGRFEATIDEKGVLNIVFSTGTIKNDFTARPTRIDWAGRKAYSARVVGLSYAERLGEAIARALPLMPADVAEQVGALKSPQTLSIMAATTLAWAVSHFFGVGEVADLVLLVAGGCLLGAAAADVAYDLNAFAKHVFDAKSEEDLDLAGQRFAAAVAKGTVNLVAAILLRRFAKSRPFRDLFQGRQPFNPRTGAPLKSTPGKWFYRPKFLRDARVPVGERGYTTPEGDIALSKDPRQFASGRPLALERLKTYFHERMHSFLTPRLQFMRDLRGTTAYGRLCAVVPLALFGRGLMRGVGPFQFDWRNSKGHPFSGGQRLRHRRQNGRGGGRRVPGIDQRRRNDFQSFPCRGWQKPVHRI